MAVVLARLESAGRLLVGAMDRSIRVEDYRRPRSPGGQATVGDAVEKAGEELGRTGRKIGDAANAVGERIEKTASGVKDAARSVVPAPAQAVFGAAVGGVAGYLDLNYVEPFGTAFSSTLLCLQLLDHEGVVALP